MTQALSKRAAALENVDSLDRYVAEINRYPVLSREDEQALAIHYKETGDVETAHRLVTANLRFVVKVAHEYKGYGFRLLDLIQEGNIGLMVAVKKFDPAREYRLISYAVWWIRAYMQNFILRSWSLVKLGTTQAQRKLFYKLRGTQAQLAKLDAEGAQPSAAQVAKELGVEISDVNEMDQRLAARDFSLDAERSSESKISHLDSLADLGDNQEELVGRAEQQDIMKDQVSSALATLNEKERYIVENRLMADEPLTLREIGEKFHISRERARQIEANVVKKVKKLLGTSVVEALA
jgi:RNA polymerase sigma-32 factor